MKQVEFLRGLDEVAFAHDVVALEHGGLIAVWKFTEIASRIRACEGYRRGLLSRHDVGRLLGLSFWGTEAFPKQRHADLDYTDEDLDRDRGDIKRASRR